MGWRIGTGCAVGAALALPEWLPRAWTREDGVVEWAGFGCYAVAGLAALVAASRWRTHRRIAIAAAVLGILLLGVAGEEISWGQRIFEVDTPAALVDGNGQDELNLHNIEGLQQKAVIGQLALAVGGSLLPLFTRWPPARVGLPLFAGYLAYRATRGAAALLGWAPAGDNAEGAELLLALGIVVLAVRLPSKVRLTPIGRGPGPNPAEDNGGVLGPSSRGGPRRPDHRTVPRSSGERKGQVTPRTSAAP